MTDNTNLLFSKIKVVASENQKITGRWQWKDILFLLFPHQNSMQAIKHENQRKIIPSSSEQMIALNPRLQTMKHVCAEYNEK